MMYFAFCKIEEEKGANCHVWMRFTQIHWMYPIDYNNLTVHLIEIVTTFENESGWVEVPNDRKNMILEHISCTEEQVIPIMVEFKNEDNKWPRAKGNDWRETLKTGDIIDGMDKVGRWQEMMVRHVYPEYDDKYGKCVVDFIGRGAEWNEELNVNGARLAKRHTFTT